PAAWPLPPTYRRHETMKRAAALALLAAALPATANIGQLGFSEGKTFDLAKPGDLITLTAQLDVSMDDRFIPGWSYFAGYTAHITLSGPGAEHAVIESINPLFTGAGQILPGNRQAYARGLQMPDSDGSLYTGAVAPFLTLGVRLAPSWDGSPVVVTVAPTGYRDGQFGFYTSPYGFEIIAGRAFSGYFIIDGEDLTEPPVPADFDGNGVVNVNDLLGFLGAFRNQDATADFDGN